MMSRLPCVFTVLSLAAFAGPVFADGVADNNPDKVRPMPPKGIVLPEADKAELTAGTEKLGKAIADLRTSLAGKPELLDLLPDVIVYHKALRYALDYNELFAAAQIPMARQMLALGLERAGQLAEGKHPWTTAPGVSIRGYVSKIDGSVQPYGLLIPEAAAGARDGKQKFRMDLWCHGRNEDLGEIKFMYNALLRPGGEYDFRPKDAFVLQLYGRYCNAAKFAGEIDALEAIADVQRRYAIDENRIVLRGFSMGGATSWHMSVHYPDLWAAVNPGAGFSETPEFLKHFQKEKLDPPAWERTLWHLYDATDWAVNLSNVPVVAYSGEKDIQKQAADMMEAAMARVGLKLTHLVGPGVAHNYNPETKAELNRLTDEFVAKGRNPWPTKIRFTTYTLRYNRCFWLTVDGLDKHWERGQVEAEIADGKIKVTTSGVTALTVSMPARHPAEPTAADVTIDGTKLDFTAIRRDRSGQVTETGQYAKRDGKWVSVIDGVESLPVLRKQHRLQGPIDDAFLDSFLMVSPTGKPLNEKVGAWADAERKHAVAHWRAQFRGDARVKADGEVTDADIAAHNLVLWGDPSSNKVLAKIADKLPIKWTADGVVVGNKTYAADRHAAVLIYPNPLNPQKYVVLNSGFTFREYDYLNNARQTPKLPDWAVVDVSVPVSSRLPGGVPAAGFFGERWELKCE